MMKDGLYNYFIYNFFMVNHFKKRCLTFKHKMEAFMALWKEVYMELD